MEEWRKLKEQAVGFNIRVQCVNKLAKELRE
jgi:hypothetical protein